MEESLYRIVAEIFEVDPSILTPDTHFRNDLGADIHDILKLRRQMNDEFQIEIPEDEMEDIQTMQDAIQYIVIHKPA